MSQLTHIDRTGAAKMFDVRAKHDTKRTAVAVGTISMQSETLHLIREGMIQKGDVLAVARIAGIKAAKVIPLYHPIQLSFADVNLSMDETTSSIYVKVTVFTTGKTGVEMEALTAVSRAALTIYDMAKAVERGIVIGNIYLLEKHGGASGDGFTFHSGTTPLRDQYAGILRAIRG